MKTIIHEDDGGHVVLTSISFDGKADDETDDAFLDRMIGGHVISHRHFVIDTTAVPDAAPDRWTIDWTLGRIVSIAPLVPPIPIDFSSLPDAVRESLMAMGDVILGLQQQREADKRDLAALHARTIELEATNASVRDILPTFQR